MFRQALLLGCIPWPTIVPCFIKWIWQYHPQESGVIRFDDPDLKYSLAAGREPIISERDTKAITFKEFIKIKGSLVV